MPSKARVVVGVTEGWGAGRICLIWAMRSAASSNCMPAALSMVLRADCQACWASCDNQAGVLVIRSTWHKSPGVPPGTRGCKA